MRETAVENKSSAAFILCLISSDIPFTSLTGVSISELWFFINIDDQLKALNKRDENELKNLITTPAVKYRRPYDVYIEEYPHLASFMASVNGNDFLTVCSVLISSANN